jgi:DNA-binding CsgD family transcriptional regulator
MTYRPRPITERQLAILADYLAHGNQPESAACLGITVRTLKNLLTPMYRSLGVDNALGAAAAVGWLWVPPDHQGVWLTQVPA